MKPGQAVPHGPSPQLGRVRWVATVPFGARTRRPVPPPQTYTGPPCYPVAPRWGFPPVVWRRPTAVPGGLAPTPVSPQRLGMVARNTTAVLWALAALTLIAAGAEIWRYVLLVLSRDSALSPEVVGASDALVLVFSLLAFVATVSAIAVTLWWLVLARSAAADEAGQDPPRPTWQVLVGTLVPGLNLVLAGSILAELEHAALRRPLDTRPRPSRLVLAWWGAWAGNGVLLVLTVAWRLRGGVQAEADAVVLTALTDASAAALAVLTVLVVRRFTRLLAPIDDEFARPLRVVRVTGAPDPGRRARPATAIR